MRAHLLLAAILCAPASASPTHADAFKLATGSGYAPYTEQALPDGGLATVIVTRAFAAAGHSVSIEWLPWKRGFDMTASKTFDATFPYVHSPERDAVFAYSIPIAEILQTVHHSASKPFPFDGPNDLAGKTVCLPLGYAPARPVDSLIKAGKIKVASPTNAAACPAMVAAGRADFWVEDPRIAASKIAALPDPKSVVAAPKPLATDTLHLIVAKDHPKAAAILASFAAGMETLRTSGEPARLLAPEP